MNYDLHEFPQFNFKKNPETGNLDFYLNDIFLHNFHTPNVDDILCIDCAYHYHNYLVKNNLLKNLE